MQAPREFVSAAAAASACRQSPGTIRYKNLGRSGRVFDYPSGRPEWPLFGHIVNFLIDIPPFIFEKVINRISKRTVRQKVSAIGVVGM